MEPTNEVKQPTTLEKIKSVARQKFEASIATANDLKKQAEAIVIKDENTLGMANQIFSKMNTHLKETKTRGLTMRQPYNDAAAIIISLEKEVTGPLDEGLKIGKDKLKIWNDLQAQIEKDKQAVIVKSKQLLDNLVIQMQAKTEDCKSPEECQILIDSINTKWPSIEKFGQYNVEAEVEKIRYITLLGVKKTSLATGNIATFKKAEEIVVTQAAEVKVAMEEKAVDLKSDLSASVNKSSTRKTPKFEIVDASMIPREWLCIDEAKVKEYLASIKGQLEAGPITSYGIKFYIDNTVVIR